MAKVVKNILSLNAEEALDFFMKEERYYTFELPNYFDFQPILDFVKERVGNAEYQGCLASDPCGLDDVNLDILQNKDGKYAIRPLALVNPYLYYFLVRDICEHSNWQVILDCFKKFSSSKVKACAIPIIPLPPEKESFQSSSIILNWWNSFEQRSVEQSLEYRYMFVTDITNCYGSINPMDIDRALSMKGTKYATAERHALADKIVMYLRALQNGHNVGIPQGSDIFNLLAEIILGYADLLLKETIEGDENISHPYEILRYRDDYRIFSNYKDELDRISYILQDVLRGLNFLMNSKKTKISDSIITDSIKQDKLFYIFNTPIYKKRRIYKPVKGKDGKERIAPVWEHVCDFNGLQKNLLYILLFSRKYPNSGQIRVQLSEFDARVKKFIDNHKESGSTTIWTFDLGEEVDLGLDDMDEYSQTGAKKLGTSITMKDNSNDNIFDHIKAYSNGPILERIRPMVAIATQIAVENVTAAHYALQVISRLVDTLDKNDAERSSIINMVYRKLRNQHNTNYLEVWLQNLTYVQKKENDKYGYTHPLCHLINGEHFDLWNNDWLVPALVKDFPYEKICNKEKLDKVTPVIKIKKRTISYEYL